MAMLIAQGDVSAGLWMLVAIVAVTLGVSFFCSICEAALYAVPRARVEQLAQGGNVRGRRLQKLRQDIDRPIAAILTLNTLAHTVGATLAGSVAASVFDNLGVGIFSAVFTLAILYLSEIIPKTIGVLYSGTLAPLLALPIQVTIMSLLPLVAACQMVTRVIKGARAQPAAPSEEDLLALARLGLRSGVIRPDEARWMENALLLDSLKVADILTPRTVVFSMNKQTTVGDALARAGGLPHSRIPVTEENDLDQVCGIVLRRHLFQAALAGRSEQVIVELMRPPTYVPETMRVGDCLAKFLRERRHLFVVADEYGGTAGVVTLEDCLETLLGSEIMDESDREADLRHLARRMAAAKLREVHREPHRKKARDKGSGGPREHADGA